jgi:hypothetical protein
MNLLRHVWKFFMSIQFGVVLIVFLMTTMMFATQFEASTSTRAMKHFIYGSKWFDLAVALFVVNIIVNTLRRRPYRFRHAGFLTVHAGVLIIVAGGLLTRYRGIDGSMPIPEGSTVREISLPESDLVVTAGGRTTSHLTTYDVTPWQTEHDDLYRIPGTPYHLRVDRYFPTGAVTDTLLDDPQRGAPTIRLAVGLAGHDPEAAWLRVGDPEHAALTHGPLRVRVAGADEAQALRAAWATPRSRTGGAGQLRLFWSDGGSEALTIPRQPGSLVPTSRKGVQVEVVQVFRSFMLAGGGAVDAGGAPENPAVRFRIVGSPSAHEEHLAFSKFPEFRMEAPEGETWLARGGEWQPSADGGAEQQLAVVHEGEGRWVTWSSWHDPADGTPLARDETRTMDGGRLSIRMLDEAERGVLSRVVVPTSKEVQNPVLLVRLVEEGKGGEPDAPRRASLVSSLWRPSVRRAAVDPNEVWLFHGEQFRFDTPHGPVDVTYRTRNIPLDFGVQLDDFREERYPGISMAASYESDVTIHPPQGDPFRYNIHMNHPLKYAGYVFYQASFQRNGDREITILSVARDPGMRLSFVGYCILVVGLLLIFFVKPYLRKLDDRWARSRNVVGG